MTKKDFPKFLAGFFFAIIVIHLMGLVFGVIPFTIKGMIFDYSFWTVNMVLFCALSIISVYFGWERKMANKVAISILSFLVIVMIVIGFRFDSDNIYLSNKKLLMASVSDDKSSEVKEANVLTGGALEELSYSFSIGGAKDDFGKFTVFDKEGNSYATGSYHGTINLDRDGKFERTSLGGIGDDTDIYVAKYSSSGGFIWGFSLGSTGFDSSNAIKIDSQNNVYLVGYFGGRADFDPSSKEYILDAGIGRDGFVAKYSDKGDFLWAQQVGNPESIPFNEDDIRFDQVSSLGIDTSDNVYIAGSYDDVIEIKDKNGNVLNSLVANKKSKNSFLIKYDKNGSYIKGLSLTGKGRNEIWGLEIDELGNIYFGGFFNSSIVLNIGDLKKVSYTAGGFDIFLAKYDSEMNHLWSKNGEE